MVDKHLKSEEAAQASGIHSAKGQKSRKPRKKLRSITVEPTDNGGHVVTHRYSRGGQDDGMFPSEEQRYSFGSGADTVNHLGSHLMKGATAKNQAEPPEFGGREEEQETEEEA
jgi:hypothetical protein